MVVSAAMPIRVWSFSLLLAASACNTGFSDQDIANVKSMVRAEFEKRPGVSVTDVTFIKESDRKLSGFVKLKIAEVEVTKSCTATMGENAQSIWKCE